MPWVATGLKTKQVDYPIDLEVALLIATRFFSQVRSDDAAILIDGDLSRFVNPIGLVASPSSKKNPNIKTRQLLTVYWY